VTETIQTDSFELKSSTVGVPHPHMDIKVADPATGDPVGFDESGELMARGFLVMKGYYNMPDKSAETIDSDGWLHTGDLATMNRAGYVNIVGRVKDMIIRGGENIYPAEIESFLMRHPEIAEAQVEVPVGDGQAVILGRRQQLEGARRAIRMRDDKIGECPPDIDGNTMHDAVAARLNWFARL